MLRMDQVHHDDLMADTSLELHSKVVLIRESRVVHANRDTASAIPKQC